MTFPFTLKALRLSLRACMMRDTLNRALAMAVYPSIESLSWLPSMAVACIATIWSKIVKPNSWTSGLVCSLLKASKFPPTSTSRVLSESLAFSTLVAALTKAALPKFSASSSLFTTMRVWIRLLRTLTKNYHRIQQPTVLHVESVFAALRLQSNVLASYKSR